MPFTLAPGRLAQFNKLRKMYEDEKQIDLNKDFSIIGMPIFFGGTDVVNRNGQIAFLEKVNTILKTDLLDEEIKTPLQRQTYIIAARFMIAACLYVQFQISSSKRNSTLYRITENNLGITTENFLDDEDKEICCLTTRQLMKIPDAFKQANTSLQKKGIQPFNEKEWKNFSKFLKKMSHNKERKNQDLNFPVISITQPFFGATCSYIGATVGVVLAEGISNSTTTIASRVQLTALVGSTLLVFSPSATTGVTLLAPIIATKLLASFCTISLAHILGTTAKYLGQGIGIGIGLPFDLAYHLLLSMCSLLSRYYNHQTTKMTPIDGIRLTDGATIIAGIPIQLASESQFPRGCIQKTLEITDTGEILIGGEEVKDSFMQIPEELIKELNKQLIICSQDKENNMEESAESKCFMSFAN